MTDRQQHDPDLLPTHTTAATSSIARWVARHHGFQVQQCHLIRRGLNDNYALRSGDGTRYVARLYTIRPRGGFNVDFELALLDHLAARGVEVAAPVPATDGRAHILLRFPEGPRALALFRHAEGVVPEALDEFELTGRTLARIHEAARGYVGPSSRYTLDGLHLAGKDLALFGGVSGIGRGTAGDLPPPHTAASRRTGTTWARTWPAPRRRCSSTSTMPALVSWPTT